MSRSIMIREEVEQRGYGYEGGEEDSRPQITVKSSMAIRDAHARQLGRRQLRAMRSSYLDCDLEELVTSQLL